MAEQHLQDNNSKYDKQNIQLPADESRKSFSDDEIQKVWNKAKIIKGKDASVYRKAYAGAWIKRDEYGNTDSTLGWEIDHRKPVAEGGSDDLTNLDPLQWNNNRTKNDDYPKWKTSMIAGESLTGRHYNAEKEYAWKIKQ